MKEYEVVCEAYNTCSPKPLVSVEEIKTDNIEDYLKQIIPPHSAYQKAVNADGDIVYEVTSDRLKKVYIFTEI